MFRVFTFYGVLILQGSTMSLVNAGQIGSFIALGIWLGGTSVMATIVGEYLFDSARWLYLKRRRKGLEERLLYWHMVGEARKTAGSWLGVAWIFFVVSALASFFWVAPQYYAVYSEPFENRSYLASRAWWPLIWLVFLVLPTISRPSGPDSWETKLNSLDALPDAFHAEFPVSEILSMYECLSRVPRFLWEEYIDLPITEINEQSNQKFRARAESFATGQSMESQRLGLLFAVLAIVIAVIAITSNPPSWLVDFMKRM